MDIVGFVIWSIYIYLYMHPHALTLKEYTHLPHDPARLTHSLPVG